MARPGPGVAGGRSAAWLARFALVLCCAVSACTPAAPNPDQARAAMKARMERPAGDRRVTVEKIHALDLSGCKAATGAAGTVCQVEMDVNFSVDGEKQRSKDSDRMRFVREDGEWRAYPAPTP